MLAALLTVLLFSCSALSGERTARYWGAQWGNLLRLIVATTVMGVVTLTLFPGSLQPATFAWLFLSGVVGFGFGDIALFFAYTRIGARLTILLNLCTAPLWSAALERVWLGTALTVPQVLAACVILTGVVTALLARSPDRGRGSRALGILAGLAAGCGQGLGAVISRKAFELAEAGAFELNGFSAAAQRVAGGLFTALCLMALLVLLGRLHVRPVASVARPRAVKWLLLTAFCGPILGVSCFQWALRELPAGLVTAVVATTPIALIPLAWAVDRDVPRPMAVAGSLVAVAGVIALIAVAR